MRFQVGFIAIPSKRLDRNINSSNSSANKIADIKLYKHVIIPCKNGCQTMQLNLQISLSASYNFNFVIKRNQKMDTATQNLENDHVNILRLIDVMEKMVMRISTDTSHMEMVVNLIRNYADGFHHAKEENLLFPFLLKKGFSNEQGPIAVMLHDHVEGRNFVKGMAAEIVEYKQGNESALPDFYTNMQGYIDLLRSHISKENNVLFRMADRVISAEEHQFLLNEFSIQEKSVFGEDKIQQFIIDIEGLEAIYIS